MTRPVCAYIVRLANAQGSSAGYLAWSLRAAYRYIETLTRGAIAGWSEVRISWCDDVRCEEGRFVARSSKLERVVKLGVVV